MPTENTPWTAESVVTICYNSNKAWLHTLVESYNKTIRWLTQTIMKSEEGSFIVLPWDCETHHDLFPVNGGDEDFVVYYFGALTDAPSDPLTPFVVHKLSGDRDPDCYYLGSTNHVSVWAYVISHA